MLEGCYRGGVHEHEGGIIGAVGDYLTEKSGCHGAVPDHLLPLLVSASRTEAAWRTANALEGLLEEAKEARNERNRGMFG